MSLAAEGRATIDERKRLGQFFTGVPLAKLLAALSDASTAASVIDPMAGIGDMLVAASRVSGPSQRQFHGVEIDPDAADRCRARLSGVAATTSTADAFDPATWLQHTATAWDLVITNPPYVRYQRATQAGAGRVTTPSAVEVRSGLIDIIQGRTCLSVDDRQVMAALARGYSGLADLAVPSWLLCASLVAPGGRLAIVVPDTWLSRNYALPVVYLLRRFFDLECVVEDADAGWFPDALVRTHLVVARRVPTRRSALGTEGLAHPYVRLTSEAAAGDSLVGGVVPNAPDPERAVADLINELVVNAETMVRPGFAARVDDGLHLRGSLEAGLRSSKALRELEPGKRPSTGSGVRSYLPRQLAEALGDGLDGMALVTLEDLGWSVGQGLRTGANRFFYATCVSERDGVSEIELDEVFGREHIEVPADALRIVVRSQRDLADAQGNTQASAGRLLSLDRYALDEDIEGARSRGVPVDYRQIPEPLAKHVRRAAVQNVGSSGTPRYIPDLSAVAPNAREGDTNRPARFWYQLPPLAPRHVGRLFVPRINHGHPNFSENRDEIVIDANFTTLWPVDAAAVPAEAMLALLGTSWALVAMEAMGTVLGGGALKLEATHLRRMPLPAQVADSAKSATAPEAIDRQTLVENALGNEIAQRLVAMCKTLLEARR